MMKHFNYILILSQFPNILNKLIDNLNEVIMNTTHNVVISILVMLQTFGGQQLRPGWLPLKYHNETLISY